MQRSPICQTQLRTEPCELESCNTDVIFLLTLLVGLDVTGPYMPAESVLTRLASIYLFVFTFLLFICFLISDNY